MPIDINIVTKRMPQPADPLKITMPCGGEVVASLPGMPVANGKALAQALMDKANAAMTPLMPIFKLIDAFLVGVEFGKSIPEMLVNPGKLIELLEKLVKAASALTKLVPPLSVPLLALEFIDALLAYLEGMIAEIEQLVAFMDKVDAMRQQADQYPSLNVVVEVSEYNLDVMRTSISNSAGAVGTVVKLVNAIMGLAGLEPIPDFSSMPEDPREMLEPLRDVVREVRRIRNLIPL